MTGFVSAIGAHALSALVAIVLADRVAAGRARLQKRRNIRRTIERAKRAGSGFALRIAEISKAGPPA